MLGLSGNDDDAEEHFNSIINIPHNQNEILEFESFMNGIQQGLQEKLKRKRRKLEKLLDGILQKPREDEAPNNFAALSPSAQRQE